MTCESVIKFIKMRFSESREYINAKGIKEVTDKIIDYFITVRAKNLSSSYNHTSLINQDKNNNNKLHPKSKF